jgi:hypothetical protein
VRRDLAERLSARAIREGKNLDAVVIEILGDGGKQEPNRSKLVLSLGPYERD